MRDNEDALHTPGDSPGAAFLATQTLHPAQTRFVACAERFSFYVGGVGAGKTTAGAVRAIARALDHPGSLGLIGAPTYPMLRDATARTVFSLLDNWLAADTEGFTKEGLTKRRGGKEGRGGGGTRMGGEEVRGESEGRRMAPGAGGYVYHKSEMRVELANGSEILFRSLDEPDRVRGLNLAWFWLDEAPLCGYYAWQVLKGRLRQRQTSTGGRTTGRPYPTAGWATGTPKGRDAFARDFELAPRPGHLLVRASTLDNAANLPDGYVEELGYTGAFYDQEVLGLFTAFAGLVYQLDTTSPPPAGHVRAPAAGQTFARVIGGVDWGYTNPTAAVVFGLDGDRRAWQLAEYYRRRAPLAEEVLPALVELTRAHGVARWWCGPDEPEHIAALNMALARAGLACRAAPADDAVVAGLQTVTSALALRGDGSRGLYIHPACVHTLAEYQTYAYPVDPIAEAAGGDLGVGWSAGGPGGGIGSGAAEASEHPLKMADHALDATRYALHSELPPTARTEAYLADLRRWVELRTHAP